VTPVNKHLRRLDEVWVPTPIYFLTACTEGRVDRLANDGFHSLAVEVWRTCERLYGWVIGRYVIMPDHVHFFAADARGVRTLSHFVGKWKEWTAKQSARRMGFPMPLWQPEFFDHLLRSSESYDQKWEYVRDNPVRAGLGAAAEDWKFQGVLNEIPFG
jgi:REP element-mobilizing transposase RayT